MLNTNLEINGLIKEPMLYKNFIAFIFFFANFTVRENYYFSNHSYNLTSYKIKIANWAGILATQNFYSILKQNNAMRPYAKIL